MDDHFRILQLALVPGVGIKRIKDLLDQYGEKIFNCEEVKELIAKSDQTLATFIANNYQYLGFTDSNYPTQLRNIPDPPVILHYLGNKALLDQDIIAVVGTRNPTRYGITMTNSIVNDLAGRGLVIASGMAFGIDRIAHEAAIKASKNSTIAVLASAVDQPTPEHNRELYKSILTNGGLILSATHPGTAIQKGMFASRNRIIAGISSATVVAEAGAKSGALLTANLAFDYNREVFAIPGNINAPKSIGCNLLIKAQKAHLVQSSIDIFNELGYNVTNIDKSDNLNVNLSKEQIILLKLIREGYDNLELLKSVLPDRTSDAILSELLFLELAGVVIKNFNGNYQISL